MNIPWRKLKEKLTEAMQAVLPIIGIVLVLCFSIAPISPSILLCFLLGAVMIIVGKFCSKTRSWFHSGGKSASLYLQTDFEWWKSAG